MSNLKERLEELSQSDLDKELLYWKSLQAITALEAKCERLEAANWQPISKLLPEHGEVLIFAPDETPSVVAGSLVACENGVEHYVQYSEELLNDAIGEVFNPTYFAEINLPSPPEKDHE